MSDRDMDRERRMRESDNDTDWDWYYYEYRYEPYYPGRNYGNRDREMYGQDYNRNYGRQYGRGSDQNYGRGRNQEYAGNYGQNYGQGYGQNYDPSRDYSPYWSAGNRTPGRYSGVGPRGYRRSDQRIQEDINDRLTWDGQIDATEVQADVKDGVVTLSGTVNSRQDKRWAEYIAENVSGVTDVQNNLKINK